MSTSMPFWFAVLFAQQNSKDYQIDHCKPLPFFPNVNETIQSGMATYFKNYVMLNNYFAEPLAQENKYFSNATLQEIRKAQMNMF